MLVGRGPFRRLLERSNPVIEVQFLSPTGNPPINPMSERWIFKTLLSSGCQHSIPVNLQMNPSVLLLKSHDDNRFSGSLSDALTDFKQLMSLSTALLQVMDIRM